MVEQPREHAPVDTAERGVGPATGVVPTPVIDLSRSPRPAGSFGEPAIPRSRHRYSRGARLDPTALAAISLLVSALFVTVSLVYNQGHLIAPLDDVYIHLQYGRQFGEGHFFQYNTGDPISTGASSLLYVVALGALWVMGFHGTGLLAAAVALGAGCFAATTAGTYLLGRRLVSRLVGLWAGGLVAVCGSLAWGATSGMEVALTAAVLTAALLAFVVETPTRAFRVTPVAATLLALVRPEGFIMAVALSAAMVWSLAAAAARHESRTWARSAGWAGWALAPVAAGTAQLLFYTLTTGTAEANGVQSKSLINQGAMLYPTEVADQVLAQVRRFLAVLAGVSTQDYLAPGALILIVLGLGFLAVNQPLWRPLALAMGIGLAAVLVSLSTLITAEWQDLRYLQPFLALLLLLLVIGVAGLGHAVTEPRARSLLVHSVLVVVLLFSLAVLPTWATRLGQQAATIREAPVSIGHWLKDNVPAGDIIAVNDAGATTYFSGHHILDLMGLTTNGMARATNNGPGSLYEALRHLPPGQRPSYFSIYHDWPGAPIQDLYGSGILGTAPVMVFLLTAPAHLQGPPMPPCQSDRSCDRVDVWKADWSLAGTGDTPDTAVPGQMRDYLNVGDLESEAAHRYTPQPAQLGLQLMSMVRTVTDPAGRRIADSGRHVIGGETFTLHGLTPNRPVILTGRLDARPPPGSDETSVPTVTAGGVPVGLWNLATDRRDGWTQSSITIPAQLVTGPDLTVTIGPRQLLLAPFPDYTSFGYWASQ